MILTEYNEKQHLENVADYYEARGKKQGFKEVEKKGLEKGLRQIVLHASSQGKSAEEIASFIGVDVQDVEKSLDEK